jgi:(S)-citramalyl-CoA lyase
MPMFCSLISKIPSHPRQRKRPCEAALRYLAAISADHTPLALRVNSTDTMFVLDDLQALLSSPANPDYLVLPKCGSAALIGLVGTLLREAGKTARIIALIESAKGVAAPDEIASADPKPAALLFGAADMAADLGAETAWEPLLWVRSRIVQASEFAAIAALDSPYFDIADIEGLKRETKASESPGFHGSRASWPDHLLRVQ